MAILYVTEQGASISRSGGRILVSKGGHTLQWLHAFNLEQLVIFGRVNLSPLVTIFLLEEGIDTVFLSTAGRFRGRLIGGEGKNIRLRREQFRRLEDPTFSLDLARRFVRGKVNNCRTIMRRHARSGSKESPEAALHRMRHAVSRLDGATTMDEIRGWEGAAAAAYFGGFDNLVLAKGFHFGGRTRRPPRDAVNALLSFGYTLLLGTIMSAVQVVGLDPYLGTLHAVDNNKPSTVLDLMEEFRPLLVDTVVLRTINRRQIVPGDFIYHPEIELPPDLDDETSLTREQYPVLMRPEALRKFILVYETSLRQRISYPRLGLNLTWRDVCQEQARLLARHIQGEETYQSFVIR